MGLVVVANLAARHRVTVELRRADEGVTALVRLPAQLLAPPAVHRTGGLFGTAAVAQSAGARALRRPPEAAEPALPAARAMTAVSAAPAVPARSFEPVAPAK